MHNSRNLFLTASILGAMVAGSAVPAAAFSFIPKSGSLSVTSPVHGHSSVTANLFDGPAFTGYELDLSGFGTLSSFAGGSYLGVYPGASYAYFSPSNVLLSSGLFPGGFGISIAPGGKTTYFGGDPMFSNFSVTTLSSVINAVPGNGNVNGGSGSFGTTAPVPEASTVVSFGLLLLGGGLMACRRQKSAAKAA